MYLAHMNYREVEEYLKHRDSVIIPVGSLENHGLHMPLGTDFLIYGLSKEWYLSHPECVKVSAKEMLTMMAEDGALIVHAHPFRDASYIDHIRLFPYHVHAIEIDNCGNKDFQNEMARLYADCYGLPHSAGSDNHNAGYIDRLAGVEFEEPINTIEDFVERMKRGEGHTFSIINENT